MKKLFLFLSSIPLLFFFACDDFSGLEIPEKISVKTAAKFEIPMGYGDIQIRKKASIEEIQKILDDNITSESSTQTKPVVYEYNPADSSGNIDDSAIMQYIINYPIKEIPLNSLKASNGQDLDTKSLENIDISGTNFSLNDFIDTINDSMSNIMAIEPKTFDIPELGTDLSLDDALAQAGIQNIGFSFTVTKPAFSSMKFESGKINITIKSPSSVSDDFSVTLKLILVDASTKDTSNPIATSEQKTITGPDVTGTLTIDLAGASIVNEMYVVISGSISGGATPSPAIKQNEYTFEMKADTSSSGKLKLAEIRGLTMTNDELAESGAGQINITENFDVGLDKSFVSATIKDGNMQFYCKYPDVAEGEEVKLSGINCDEAVFSLTGGMSKNGNPLNDFVDKGGIGYIVNKELDLAGAMISKNVDTDSDGKEDTCRVSTTGSYIKPSLHNATIVFPKAGETLELTLGGVCSIKKIGEMTFNLGDLNSFTDTIETGLDLASILDDVLGDSKNLIDDIKFDGIEGYIFITQPTNNLDLKDLVIKGYVEARYEKSGVVKTPVPIVGTSDDDSGKAEMKMKTTKKVSALVDDKIETEVQTTLPALAGKSKIVGSSVLFDHNDSDCSGESHLHSYKVGEGILDDLLNAVPENLSIYYNLGLTSSKAELTLTEADLESLSTDASVSISLALVVPLTVNLEDNADIPDSGSSGTSTDGVITIKDVQSLAKSSSDPDKDLLDRDSAKDTDFLKYTDSLKTLYMSYSVVNNLILNAASYTDAEGKEHPAGEDLDLKLTLYTVDLNGAPKDIFDPDPDTGNCEKVIPVADGRQKLEFSPDEVQKILSKDGYPFIPKIRAEITVPKDANGDSQIQYIPRDGEFAVSGTLHIEFDKDIPVEVWSK